MKRASQRERERERERGRESEREGGNNSSYGRILAVIYGTLTMKDDKEVINTQLPMSQCNKAIPLLVISIELVAAPVAEKTGTVEVSALFCYPILFSFSSTQRYNLIRVMLFRCDSTLIPPLLCVRSFRDT